MRWVLLLCGFGLCPLLSQTFLTGEEEGLAYHCVEVHECPKHVYSEVLQMVLAALSMSHMEKAGYRFDK